MRSPTTSSLTLAVTKLPETETNSLSGEGVAAVGVGVPVAMLAALYSMTKQKRHSGSPLLHKQENDVDCAFNWRGRSRPLRRPVVRGPRSLEPFARRNSFNKDNT